jgi:hypothetical protein
VERRGEERRAANTKQQPSRVERRGEERKRKERSRETNSQSKAAAKSGAKGSEGERKRAGPRDD